MTRPIYCNMCGSEMLETFNGREHARCVQCSSLERHRMCFEVIDKMGLLDRVTKGKILHLSPEKVLGKIFSDSPMWEYRAFDLNPDSYSWTDAKKIDINDQFIEFESNEFDLVIHNHVLEHIPGHWKDHLTFFHRIIANGGHMIFSVPGPVMSRQTEEGGEHLESDSERELKFGQKDHVRQFGYDIEEFCNSFQDMRFSYDSINSKKRQVIGIKPGSNRIMIWSKQAKLN